MVKDEKEMKIKNYLINKTFLQRSIDSTEKSPYGFFFFCCCGYVIHVKEEELTPPKTIVKCDYCGRKNILFTDDRRGEENESKEYYNR